MRGVLETTQREMTVTLEKTARSSVFNLAHDYSNALFDDKPEMILQGQDIPIHLGSLIPAMKAVAGFYGDDIHPGDVIYHNDPAYQGSHAIDCCMYKPVFYNGELAFWTVCKGHVTDIGGPVPAGYNPDAKEIYAECLRIPPVKLWLKGERRDDVINLILTNIRSRRDQEGDLNAQLGACKVGERNLIALLDKYGVETVRDCIAELMGMADRHMRSLIAELPDGVYEESAVLEDAGHGYGDIEIKARVEIRGDGADIAIDSPPQIPYFINSYSGNTMSGIYLGIMMFAQVGPALQRGSLPLFQRGRRAARHDLQRAGAGAAHELHDDAHGDACRRCPQGLRGRRAGPGRRVLGPLQRPQHRRHGHPQRRRICHDGSGDHNLGGRCHGLHGRLACVRTAMLLRRVDFGRRGAPGVLLPPSSSTAMGCSPIAAAPAATEAAPARSGRSSRSTMK